MAVWSFTTFLIFYFSFCNNISVSVHSDKSNSTFTPTNEWKKIEEGQSLIPGLHVRINLHTGEKEAKLPDNDSDDKKSLAVVPENGSENDKKDTLDPDKLKTLLKNIKSDEGKPVKGNFRSYEVIKEDFNKLRLDMKTDIEILIALIDDFKRLNSEKNKERSDPNLDWAVDEDLLGILVDLEYLVHQYDNAQEFAKQNGFSDVIYVSLNSTNSEIRSEALRLLGSAAQSNPKVQIAALDSGAVHLLLKVLTFDEDINVRSRSLYALSCLTRRFPAAQQKLITDGGFTAFGKVFDQEKQDYLKLQVKIITLIHDLLLERKDTKMNMMEEGSRNQTDSKVDLLRERLQQYEKMDLERRLVEQEWCKRIPEWFTKQNHVRDLNRNPNVRITLDSVNMESHDVVEKVVETLFVLSDLCRAQFESDVELVDMLFSLRDIYSELALAESRFAERHEDSNQFFTSVSNVLKILTDKLKGSSPKDEL